MPNPAARWDPFGLDPSSQVCGTSGTVVISGCPANGWSSGKDSYNQASVSRTCCW